MLIAQHINRMLRMVRFIILVGFIEDRTKKGNIWDNSKNREKMYRKWGGSRLGYVCECE